MNMSPLPYRSTPLKDFEKLKADFMQENQRALDMQTLRWLYFIPVHSVISANDGDDQQVDIKSDAHFKCLWVTGDYTTIGAEQADVGACQITVRVSDASQDLKLMNSAVPLDLFLSPGRVLNPGIAGNPSNSLFNPFPFGHIFAANGGILCEFQNAAGGENAVNLLFVGLKLRAR